MLFKSYEYFLRIVEEETLSKAAAKLHISQPSLSKYLKRLEESLGVELFNHKTSPLKLTYAGELYLKYVLRIMELDKQLETELSEIMMHERGKVTLGIPLWRGSCTLPDILPVLVRKYPNITLDIVEGKDSFVKDELLQERLDFCIMNSVSSINYSGLVYDVIMNERILLAAPKTHPLIVPRNSESVNGEYPHFDISALKHEQLFLTKQGQSLTYVVKSLFDKYNMQPENIMETENLSTAINLVAAKMGFAFIPEGGAKPGLISDNIALFTVDTPILTCPLAIFRKESAYTTQTANTIINAIKKIYLPALTDSLMLPHRK